MTLGFLFLVSRPFVKSIFRKGLTIDWRQAKIQGTCLGVVGLIVFYLYYRSYKNSGIEQSKFPDDQDIILDGIDWSEIFHGISPDDQAQMLEFILLGLGAIIVIAFIVNPMQKMIFEQIKSVSVKEIYSTRGVWRRFPIAISVAIVMMGFFVFFTQHLLKPEGYFNCHYLYSYVVVDDDKRVQSCSQVIEDPSTIYNEKIEALRIRGEIYFTKSKLEEALADFSEVARIYTHDAWSHNAVGVVRSKLGQTELAIADYSHGIEIDPDAGYIYSNRGRARSELRLYEAAIEDFRRAIELNPNRFDAFNLLAWTLATAQEPEIRNGEEAIQFAGIAIELEDSPNTRDTLAAALAEAGYFDQAVEEMDVAVRKEKERGGKRLSIFEKRRELYRNKRPLRCPGEFCQF